MKEVKIGKTTFNIDNVTGLSKSEFAKKYHFLRDTDYYYNEVQKHKPSKKVKKKEDKDIESKDFTSDKEGV